MFLLWYDLRKAQHERKQLLKNNLYHTKRNSLVINKNKTTYCIKNSKIFGKSLYITLIFALCGCPFFIASLIFILLGHFNIGHAIPPFGVFLMNLYQTYLVISMWKCCYQKNEWSNVKYVDEFNIRFELTGLYLQLWIVAPVATYVRSTVDVNDHNAALIYYLINATVCNFYNMFFATYVPYYTLKVCTLIIKVVN